MKSARIWLLLVPANVQDPDDVHLGEWLEASGNEADEED